MLLLNEIKFHSYIVKDSKFYSRKDAEICSKLTVELLSLQPT